MCVWKVEQLRNCNRNAHNQEQRLGIVGCIKVEWVCRGDNTKQCMYGKLR